MEAFEDDTVGWQSIAGARIKTMQRGQQIIRGGGKAAEHAQFGETLDDDRVCSFEVCRMPRIADLRHA